MTTLDLLKVLVPSVAAVAAFAYYMAHMVDHGISDLAKQELISFAKKRRLLPASRSAFKFFLYASDRYFGKKLISWKALLKSVLLSGVWIVFVLALCIAFFPNYRSWLGQGPVRHLIVNSALPLVLAALFIDYVSICITRSIIKASMGKGAIAPFLAILLDLFVSILLFYLLFSLTKTVIQPGDTPLGPIASLQMWFDPSTLPSQMQFLDSLTRDMLVKVGDGQYDIKGQFRAEVVYAFPESILFLSSLLTSVWLWLYCVGYMLLYAAVRIDMLSGWAKVRLNIDHSPANALAITSVVAYALICCAILLVHTIVKLFA